MDTYFAASLSPNHIIPPKKKAIKMKFHPINNKEKLESITPHKTTNQHKLLGGGLCQGLGSGGIACAALKYCC